MAFKKIKEINKINHYVTYYFNYCHYLLSDTLTVICRKLTFLYNDSIGLNVRYFLLKSLDVIVVVEIVI